MRLRPVDVARYNASSVANTRRVDGVLWRQKPFGCAYTIAVRAGTHEGFRTTLGPGQCTLRGWGAVCSQCSLMSLSSGAKHCHVISYKRRLIGQCCRPCNDTDSESESDAARPSVYVSRFTQASARGKPRCRTDARWPRCRCHTPRGWIRACRAPSRQGKRRCHAMRPRVRQPRPRCSRCRAV